MEGRGRRERKEGEAEGREGDGNGFAGPMSSQLAFNKQR